VNLEEATPLPQPPPKASILIPAKDEAGRIEGCLRSALAQDYPNFEVIAVDDRSTDGTAEVMDSLAAFNPPLKVIHIPDEPLPPGWTGKNHALHAGAARASGEWLLFIDSDVVIEPHALSRTVAVAQLRRFDLVSLMPRLVSGSFWERLIVPLAGAALVGLHTAGLANKNELPGVAFANGQFMLFRRSAYEQVGRHEVVKDQFCEDIAIARKMKAMGLRPRIGWGPNLAACRMYSSFSQIMRGWARIFCAGDAGRPWRILIGIASLLLCVFPVFAAIAMGAYRSVHPVDMFGGWGWLGTAGAHLGLMIVFLGITYRWTGNPARMAALFPLSTVILLIIYARGLWMCLTGKVEWRGTRYAHQMQRA
jgi:glycosyltransferase involved in cell wall biosynthesis